MLVVATCKQYKTCYLRRDKQQNNQTTDDDVNNRVQSNLEQFRFSMTKYTSSVTGVLGQEKENVGWAQVVAISWRDCPSDTAHNQLKQLLRPLLSFFSMLPAAHHHLYI